MKETIFIPTRRSLLSRLKDWDNQVSWSGDPTLADRGRVLLQQLAAADAREFAPLARSLLAELAAREKAEAASVTSGRERNRPQRAYFTYCCPSFAIAPLAGPGRCT
jgi:hypothetical protein